jgi:peptide/nickel transport system ATP-binding protein
VVESGPAARIYDAPAHPYTQGLLGSIIDPLEKKRELTVLPGSLPDLAAPPGGCRFHPRCPKAMPVCGVREPPMVEVAPGHSARCWLHVQEGATG